MTKLESGAVVPNVTLHDLGEIVGSALRRAGADLGATTRSRSILRLIYRCSNWMRSCSSKSYSMSSTTLPKYSPAGSTIRLQSWRDAQSVYLSVLDEGEGIPPADLEHIFDKFYRVQKTATRCAPVPGSGSRFPAASSTLCTAPSRREPHRPTAAQCSRSRCRSPTSRSDRRPGHERRCSHQGSGGR